MPGTRLSQRGKGRIQVWVAMTHGNHEILKLIGQGESLRLEFKSDRNGIPDRELVAAIVALANTEGGELLLGVEDDGTVTGIKFSKKEKNVMPSIHGKRSFYTRVYRNVYGILGKYPMMQKQTQGSINGRKAGTENR